MKLNQRQLRRLISHEKNRILKETSERESELRELFRGRGGKKVVQAGDRIRSAGAAIFEVSEDHTGAMKSTLREISEFVGKLGASLSGMGTLDEGDDMMTAADTLPTVSELKKLHKSIKKLSQ